VNEEEKNEKLVSVVPATAQSMATGARGLRTDLVVSRVEVVYNSDHVIATTHMQVTEASIVSLQEKRMCGAGMSQSHDRVTLVHVLYHQLMETGAIGAVSRFAR